MKKHSVPIYVTALLLCYLSASAKEPSASPEKPGKTIPTAPVKLGSETIFNVLEQVKGIPLRNRAQQLSERLKEIADDLSMPIDSFAIKDYTEPMTVITVQQNFFMAVLDDDAKAAGRSRQEYASELSLKGACSHRKIPE